MNKDRTMLICVETVDLDDRAYGFFNTWLVELEVQGVKAIVVCLRKGRMSPFKEHEIILLPSSWGFLAMRRLFCLWRIAWSRRHDYSSVFVRQSTVYVMAAGWLWRLLGKRIVLWYAHYKGRWDLNIAARIAHVVVTSVPEACRTWSRKAVPIGQSIDTERFRISEKKTFDQYRVLVLGRISPVKRIEEIIECFERGTFRERGGSLTLLGKQGNEEYGNKIRALIQNNPVIRWHEEGIAYDALPSELSTYDFLMNFYEGSLDKAILECMASGIIPLVSTDSAEGVFPNELHWLIARTTQERLQTIKTLAVLTPDERRVIAEALRNVVVQSHSLSHQVARLVELSLHEKS